MRGVVTKKGTLSNSDNPTQASLGAQAQSEDDGCHERTGHGCPTPRSDRHEPWALQLALLVS